ncbi:BTAD domain-containing putative transcriptional regulator [Streptomyces sp. NPDC002668]|uniref:BTAD domain-containing putative transcriptional regulator n=1 Tax=Streptomyces sp. NPDC002668 TaxID=3154422 RepID=UPI0033167CC8
MQGHGIRFGLLGPVEARRGAEGLDLGPPKRRVLLARLLIESGQPVSVDHLCRDLWPADRRPSGAISSVHAHISRLRTVLEPGRATNEPATLLVRRPGGYVLEAPRDALDSVVFETSVNSARELLNSGRTANARQEIDRALKLWRGPALRDAADHEFAAAEIARLEASRQLAEELRVTLLLEEGDAERAAGLAEGLIVSAPLREASWALLMRALYATGRSAEALHQYERLRIALAEDLGVGPGPVLRDLHLAILRHDSEVLLAARPQRIAGAPRGEGSDGRLPLVGRSRESARLGALLAAAAAGRVRWAVLTGESGSGKTRLLEETAARAAEQGFAVAGLRCCPAVDNSRKATDLGPAARLLAELRSQAPSPHNEGASHAEPAPQDRSEEACLAELVREFAARPVLCMVDDLDGTCPVCLRLLHRLAILLREEKLAVLCAVRAPDEPATGRLLAELARQRAARLHLGPLGVEDVAHLLTAAGEADSIVEAAALHRRSDGNPFLLLELLQLPAAQRMGPTAQIPAAVESVVLTRLEALPEPVRTMLVHAAVSGESLDIEVLAHLQGLSREELLELIADAFQARILVRQDGEPDGQAGCYRFHGMLRDAVLATLTPAGRQLLHANCATALDALPGRHPAHSASHLVQAGPAVPVEELARAFLRAGRRCARDRQNDAATGWFERAAKVAGAEHPAIHREAIGAAQLLAPGPQKLFANLVSWREPLVIERRRCMVQALLRRASKGLNGHGRQRLASGLRRREPRRNTLRPIPRR